MEGCILGLGLQDCEGLFEIEFSRYWVMRSVHDTHNQQTGAIDSCWHVRHWWWLKKVMDQELSVTRET